MSGAAQFQRANPITYRRDTMPLIFHPDAILAVGYYAWSRTQRGTFHLGNTEYWRRIYRLCEIYWDRQTTHYDIGSTLDAAFHFHTVRKDILAHLEWQHGPLHLDVDRAVMCEAGE